MSEVDPQQRVLRAGYDRLVRSGRYNGTYEQYLATLRDLHHEMAHAVDPFLEPQIIASQQANARLLEQIIPTDDNE